MSATTEELSSFWCTLVQSKLIATPILLEWMGIRSIEDQNSGACREDPSFEAVEFHPGWNNIHYAGAITHKFVDPLTDEVCFNPVIVPYLYGIVKQSNTEFAKRGRMGSSASPLGEKEPEHP